MKRYFLNFAVSIVVLVMAQCATIDAWAQEVIKETTKNSSFFRFEAAYLHKDERIDFNVVVGCGVYLTTYSDNDRSVDTFRDPVAFMKATSDGGAILQMIPSACGRETSAGGSVPPDFLPGAVWYKDKRDISLGVAYVTEDAFESPSSELKFLGATISRATEKEWRDFEEVGRTNLIDWKRLVTTPVQPTEEEVKKYAWDKAKIAEWTMSSIRCRAALRLEITDATSRAKLAKYWPEHKPRYWTVDTTLMPTLYREVGLTGPVRVNGLEMKNIFQLHPHGRGFPTRIGSGIFDSGKPWSFVPQPMYPVKSTSGVPWMNPDRKIIEEIVQEIPLGEEHRGFAYCYSNYYGSSPLGKFYWPNYFELNARTIIDGVEVEWIGSLKHGPGNPMTTYFENDYAIYLVVNFSLT